MLIFLQFLQTSIFDPSRVKLNLISKRGNKYFGSIKHALGATMVDLWLFKFGPLNFENQGFIASDSSLSEFVRYINFVYFCINLKKKPGKCVETSISQPRFSRFCWNLKYFLVFSLELA